MVRNVLSDRYNMNKIAVFIEKSALVVGAALVLLAGLVWADGAAKSRAAVAEFERLEASQQEAVAQDSQSTLAVLRIESAGMEVPVFDSTSSADLKKGAGHVAGSVRPGGNGNIAIAGHRDTFFRGLKDVKVGMEIEMTTPAGSRTFRVSSLEIVDPLDVSVLDPTDDTVLTLITCYPFYYVGPAPDRYIVRAELVQGA